MFEQVKLNYDFTALEPYIDAATMEVHYTGHHATYCKNFNDLIAAIPELQGKTVEEILMNLDKAPEAQRTALKNNGGGYYNHNLYFESLSPKGGQAPSGALAAQITADFGDFDTLVAELKKAALAQFGSGYAWLVYDPKEQKLAVTKDGNQESPVMDGVTKALLPIDVWEHAYYLKHKNKRAAYLDDLFQVIDWDVVARRFEA